MWKLYTHALNTLGSFEIYFIAAIKKKLKGLNALEEHVNGFQIT